MKKSSLIGLSALLALTACTKTETEVRYLPQESVQTTTISSPSHEADVNALRSLLSSKAPNLALAELLAKSIAREHGQYIKDLFANLSAEEAKAVIVKVHEDNQSIRKNYLFRGEIFKDDSLLVLMG